MRIGIVSDSHGRKRALEAALAILAQREVDAVVHCGDIISAECMEMLGSVGVPAYAVAGNMDRHPERLWAAAAACGVHYQQEVIQVPIDGGGHLVVTHGNDPQVLGELVADAQFPYVCHGHTHEMRDERVGKVRVINPGALYHARPHTVAILDTQLDTLDYVLVPG